MPPFKVTQWLVLFAALLTIDRLSKLASQRLGAMTPNGFFYLAPTLNTHWLLGLINSSTIITYLILLLLLAVVIMLARAITKNQTSLTLGWGLVLIGGASNYWDRLWYGGVIDFINLLNLTQFNLADLYLIVGFTVLILKGGKIYVR